MELTTARAEAKTWIAMHRRANRKGTNRKSSHSLENMPGFACFSQVAAIVNVYGLGRAANEDPKTRVVVMDTEKICRDLLAPIWRLLSWKT